MNHQYFSKANRLFAKLLFILMLAVPQLVAATAVDETYNYSVTLSSTHELVIKCPVLNKEGTDSWIVDGNLYYKVEDNDDEYQLLHYYVDDSDNDVDDDDYWVWTHVKTKALGQVYLTHGADYDEDLLEYDTDVRKEIHVANKGKTIFLKLRWVVPSDYRGKKLTFTWKVKRKRRAGSEFWIDGFEKFDISIPSGPPRFDVTVAQPIILPDSVGKLIVPWLVGTDNVQNTKYVYNDIDNQEVQVDISESSKGSGMILLDPVVPHRSFYVKLDYVDSDGYLVKDVQSAPADIPMIHAPLNFKVSPTYDEKNTMVLSWKINAQSDPDLLEGDAFEIQRSVTGSDNDFITIALEYLDLEQQEYEFRDSTILPSLTKEMINEWGDFPSVRYRIRRVVSQMWGWRDNPVAAFDYYPYNKMQLFTVKNAKIEKVEGKKDYSARVTWEYNSSEDIQYIWDERAEMNLRVLLYNRDGLLVDSIVRPLTMEEIHAKEAYLSFVRPCVNYRVEIVTSQGTSPFDVGIKTFIIKDDNDFRKLCDYFNSRDYNPETQSLYVRLESDLELMSNDKYVFENGKDYPFVGLFDGNGHTIKAQNTILFKSLKNAHVCSLNYVYEPYETPNGSGVLAQLAENTIIKNCRVDYKLRGLDYFAGFVYEAKDVTISNSLSYARELNYHTSCELAGFIYSGIGNNVIENSLFAMANNADDMFYMKTRDFYYGGECELRNCYYYLENTVYYLQNEQGERFREKNVEEWLESLGKEWITSGEEPGVAPKKEDLGIYNPQYVYVPAEGETFYFEATGRVSKKLSATPRQSSVLLEWGIENDVVDYFEVLRREYGSKKDWDIVISGLNDMIYEDKTVSPLLDYEYTVRSAVDCEGTNYHYSDTVVGYCKHTGLVEGYVRFADGTGIPNVEVIISGPNGFNDMKVTDVKGKFAFDNLSYFNQNEVVYYLSVNKQGKMKLEPEVFEVKFNDRTNYTEMGGFVVTEGGYRFSGYVMYEGTSIPVQGANFSISDNDVYNAQGQLVETDFNGKFSFYVLGDQQQEITVKKDGHEFGNGGKFTHTFNDHLAGIFFYDITKVKLVGKVVGGDTQGNLPLGHSLSYNNLGNDLTMVLTLEGDNTSNLVFENTNPTLSERDTVYRHEAHDNLYDYQTKVKTHRKRMEVFPDPHTGEYVLMLPPVKWKVQQIYCEGYATLFQDGMVSDVIDLTNSTKEKQIDYVGTWASHDSIPVTNPTLIYNAIYNRIYHAPVELTYKQLGYDTFDYFGDKTYTAHMLGEKDVEVPLAYQKKVLSDNGKDSVMVTKYTFNHPVFSLGRKYTYRLTAVERYFWNNNTKSDTVDVVKMKGGKVTIHNGMISSTHKEVVDLDNEGTGYTEIFATQMMYNLSGDNALRTVSMTLEVDSTTYEAKPLKGYVLNVYTISGASDVLNSSVPVLVDILRDPPGGGSSATLSKGSTLKYSYTMDMKWSAGVKMDFSTGSGLNNYYGVVVTPTISTIAPTYGLIQDAKTGFSYSNEIVFSGKGTRAFTYTMSATEDIKTSTSTTMTGADADIYIGVVQNNIVKKGVTVRAIPDNIFQQMVERLPGGILPNGKYDKDGTMIEFVEGQDADGNIYHLIRDESLIIGPEVTSTFAHTQKYITTQLIPDLVEQCRALMFIGTPEEAQRQANASGKNVYLSLRQPDDKDFAMMNSEYYTLAMHQDASTKKDSMNYVIVLPNGVTDEAQTDEVEKYCGIMKEWIQMIINNEEAKLNAKDLVRNFDVDGGAGMTYTENFESSYTNSFSTTWPLGISTDDYFGNGTEASGSDFALVAANMFGATFGKFIVNLLSKVMKNDNVKADWGHSEVEVNFTGSRFKFLVYPTMSYSVTPNNSTAQTYNRKESFSISMNNASHLNFDVYRAKNQIGDGEKQDDIMNVFTSDNFYAQVGYNEAFLKRHWDLGGDEPYRFSRGFVYRTRGGATARPWEDERKTVFYKKGTVLDARTKKIENPKIMLDKQSVSGVPYGEAARFKIYMTNDSEEPNAITNGLSYFQLYQDETSNPNGAKLVIDGAALTGSFRPMYLQPGKVTEKTLEVYAGEDFDYENLTIGILSDGDPGIKDLVSFDVHYLREAGPVNISTPGDKWVMNTDAQYNEKRGYYLPVIIDGFDRKQKNFDHIEFQYKESARGDDFWTNLCSFYASDSLMALANGTKERMPENGFIETQFYGEGVVTEKAYDLRAVLYIRNGSSFITSSSKVLSGIKDTRRPRIFGTPSPTDGVLDIGDNVVFDFSEAIEHNYLDEKVNFEVKGEVNNDNFSEQVSLLFDPTKKNCLETEIERNFSGKDLTVSVMIKPDETGNEMPIFSHGTDNKKLQLWLTKNKQLKVVVNGNEYTSDATLEFSSFRQVSMVITQPEKENDPCHLMLYNGGNQVGNFEMKEPYTGIGRLIFGRTNEENRNDRRCKFYSGRMMEARVWYRALNGAQIGSTYGFKRLTGYEKGLVDYYPMNEGDGSYVTDKAQGAHAQIIGATWALPRGMSLHIDWEDRGIGLTSNAINRTADQDYTLMFWFRTDNTGHGALISNGAGYATDEGAVSQFYIGFEGDTLRYRSNGMTVDVPGRYDDSKWHHYAMTVNRARNVANIYIDRTLRSTFAVDTLGGISGGYPLLGGTLHKTVGSSMVEDTHNWLRGNLDDICMFEQALPLTLIKNYSLKSPYGDESGLMFYLGFSRQELQSNNQYETVKYPYSQRIHKDADGNIVYQLDSLTQKPTSIPVRDYLFTDPVNTILSHIDETYAAPVKPAEELKQLNFSYVGRDNQLLINIDEPTEYINKRNVYVTIRDIPDMNGNNMASPVTINCFVDCNPLRWEAKTLSYDVHYGDGFEIGVLIRNVSGSGHTYEVTNNPKWLTVSPRVNTIDAKDETFLTFTINKNLNVGTYDEILYLTDENGLSEPLSLHITVFGDEPEWTVDRSLRLFTMNIVGQVVMGNQRDYEIVTDSRDIVGVFDRKGVCHGVNHITYDEETGSSLVYLTVYNDSTALDELYFKLWHYSTGKEMILDNYDNIKFVTSKLYGRRDAPCIFYADNKYVQTLDLEKGWNWVSFYVYSTSFTNLDRLLNSFPWQNGDIITDNTSGKTLVYANNHWTLSESMDSVSILPRNFYAVKVKEDISVQVGGYIVKDERSRTIYVYPEWNSIGYTPMVNLPLETALAGYFTNAKDGDIIKSHDEFSIFNESAGGGGRWEGSLQYMRPGEGYMLYSQVPKVVKFTYPFYEPNSSFVDVIFKAPEKPQHNPYPTTMSLTAVADGLTLEPGDRLIAYADGEMCGTATMTTDSLFFVSIGGDKSRGLSFAIEREGDIIATTPEVMTFQANAVAGKPSLPTHINFAQREIPRFGWYTLDGIRLQGKPAKKGVYIYNGKKRVVE